ncbi:hypothetical protein B5X24_HaOG211649 [Helicoverpa armigera]|uniref:Uncharacterized protein n=1 Tax=Helicoverpa armigera TaxID=29058 RepID=A0A2W1BCX2_HELAM|nr:hypothetical protein B5X24_HaOG211649 [Helicoverpa armigera]
MKASQEAGDLSPVMLHSGKPEMGDSPDAESPHAISTTMKYANIMCERAPELAESPHAAPAWPSLREPLRCPPEEALWTFPGVDRAPRSRSSPVR